MVREYFEDIDDLEYSRVQFFQFPNNISYFRRNQSCFEFQLPADLVNLYQFDGCFYFKSINGGPWKLISGASGRRVLTAFLYQLRGRLPTVSELHSYPIPWQGPGIVSAPDSYPLIRGTRLRRVRRFPRR